MQIPSRYDVRREIGRGGMGVVYEAHDTRLRRSVAVKVLPNAASDLERRARFAQEARAASALNHPNIVTIHDIESVGADDCIVMEYVDGEPLSARMAAGACLADARGRESRPMSVPDAIGYAAQIASALAAAHGVGIVHRDLKPANVMVTRDGRVKVVDFGLSKLLPHAVTADGRTETHVPQTEPGIVAGTSGYMSPEQASGDPVDARTDIFSFGVLLYEMLAGKRAFSGDSYWSALRAVLHQDPEPLGRIRADVPGSYSLTLGEDERMVMSYYFNFVARSGRAVVMPDFQGFYSRRSATPARARDPERESFRDRVVQSAKDLSRTMDYLETRADIDAAKVVYYVFSVGGSTLAVPGMEPRLKGIIFLSAGLPRRPYPPEIEPVNIAPRIRVPVLFLGGRYDYLTPIETSQKALFDRLGTPAALKKHVIFDSGHVPERIAVIREVLDWLDRTLGPVRTQ